MTAPLWTVAEMASAMAAEIACVSETDITEISIDSRSLSAGAAYFAIQGVSQDGHLYVDAAINAGASVAVVARDKAQEFLGKRLPLLIVEDVLVALEMLGREARARCDGKIIAVTGSAGKTSTKEIMRAVYANIGNTHASQGSFNNHWGVPLTLARMPRETEFGIFEIGMNHAGEITPLVGMVRPHVAIVTTIGPAHLGHFNSVAEIAKAKAEIFSGLVENGVAIIPQDNPYVDILIDQIQRDKREYLSFGLKNSNIMLNNIDIVDGISSLNFSVDGSSFKLSLNSVAEHMALNALSVVGSLKALALLTVSNLSGFTGFVPGGGRGETKELELSQGGTIQLLDESYNANPLSVAATLKTLVKMEPRENGRHIAILGDMLELGEESEKLHKAISVLIEKFDLCPIFLVGPEMKALFKILENQREVYWTETSDKMVGTVLSHLRDGDCILVKGSLGIKMKTVIEAIKQS